MRSVSPVESFSPATFSAFNSSIEMPGADAFGQW